MDLVQGKVGDFGKTQNQVFVSRVHEGGAVTACSEGKRLHEYVVLFWTVKIKGIKSNVEILWASSRPNFDLGETTRYYDG